MMAVRGPRSDSLVKYVPRYSAEWELRTTKRWQEIDGTLCYVDISGFTALSEKLARRGRIGAEELTEVLNHVFGRMLAVTYDRGGSLLKFGGDALLLMFAGDNHAIQGCSAAVEMQDALREAANYRTSAGRLRLKMSVGLHSGTIHLFRVGASHKELIITGPAASMTTEMEETAVAGEVLISAATVAALPDGAATVAKGNGWLLRWRKARAGHPGWTPRIPLDEAWIAGAMPVALRDHLSHGAAEPEHHIATVGFIRYTGIGALMEAGGPEAAADALDQLVTLVQEAVDAEGVTFLATDIDQDGGKIILVAGVPSVQEDDEGRVLRSARRIADADTALDLRIGINQGHVFVGEIGADFRATYTIMGDTVNLAARLMAAASPGEVYAGPAALDHAATLFETRALEPFHVKGKARPVQAHALGRSLGSRPTRRSDELSFAGRDDELAFLNGLVEDLLAGRGHAVSIIGERGIGKSRLVDEMLPSLGQAVHIYIRAEPYGIASPYRPLRDPLRKVLGVERAEPEAMAGQLRDAVAARAPDLLPYLRLIGDVAMVDVPSTRAVDEIDPEFRQDRTADVVVELFSTVWSGPVCFEVEDGDYMDDASALVMGRVAAASADHPWLVLTTRRDVTGGFEPGGHQVRLGPLSDDESRGLVHASTEASPLRPHDIEAIVSRAGGLPLFLEEILRTVRGTSGVGSLPDSLDAVISAQIDALPPLTRKLLRFASVLGRSFRVEILNDLVAQEGVRLDSSTRRGLTGFLDRDGPGRLRFRHALIRDVAYAGLSFKRRRQLHLRAGEAAERAAGAHTDAAADVLALHFSLGQDHERAWRYARSAGRQAAESYANVDAAAHYRRALESGRRLAEVTSAEQAAVWTALGDVSERTGLFEDALDAYRRASRLVGEDPEQRAELLLRRALVRRRSGAYRSALRETSHAMRLVEESPATVKSTLRCRLLAERGAIRRRQQQPKHVLRLALLAEAEARAVGSLETLGHSLDLIDWAARMMGRADHAVHYAETLSIFETLGDLSGVAQVWNNLGADAFWEGRWVDAIDAYEKSREAEERTGNAVQAAISAANIAELLINQGRLEAAEPLLTGAVRVLRASNHAAAATFAESELARLLIRQDRHRAGEELLEDIRRRAIAGDEPMSALNASIQLADSKLRQGNVRDALALIEGAEGEAGEAAEPFIPTIARLRASGLATQGRYDDALASIGVGLDQARRQGLLFDQALLLATLSEIVVRAGGSPDPADVEAADRLFDEMGIRREPILGSLLVEGVTLHEEHRGL